MSTVRVLKWGPLPSGSGCILDVWLARKTGNTPNIYHWGLVTQVIEELRHQERTVLAGTLCQPLGWRDKGSISRVPGGGVRRQKWNHGGSGVMEETQLLSVSLRQRMRKRNTLIYSCSPCHGLTGDCHSGRSQLTQGPGASNLQAGVSLPEKQDRGRPRNGWEANRPCLAQWICLDDFFTFNHNDFILPWARPWQISCKLQMLLEWTLGSTSASALTRHFTPFGPIHRPKHSGTIIHKAWYSSCLFKKLWNGLSSLLCPVGFRS